MSEQNLNDILSGGGLSSLLQNPEIAAKLPRIMEALGPVMAEMRAENGETPKNEESGDGAKSQTQQQPIESILASTVGKGKNKSSARRCALLKALEPYLSENRREALDYIIKVTSLIDILSEVM